MTMTLQEMLPAIKQLPPADKAKLRLLLATEGQSTPNATTFESLHFLEGKPNIGSDDFPFTDGVIYEIYSPWDCSGVKFLLQALKQSETENPTCGTRPT